MKQESRRKQLARAMSERKVDAVIIPPSGDLNFFFGFNPGGCERFQAVFALKDGRLFCVTNRIYEEAMAKGLPDQTPMYVWDDAGCFEHAVDKAFRAHGLSGAAICISDAVRAVDLMAIQETFPACRFSDARELLSSCRIQKTQGELDDMRQAGRLADKVMEELKSFIRPGRSELDIKNFILDFFDGHNAGLSFTPIVASGSNNSRPHYNRYDRVLTKSDVIILDLGCKVNGFCSDISRTYFIAEPDDRKKQIYAVVKQAFEAAASIVREGVAAQDVDHAARSVIEQAGFGAYFLNRTGHGIGMDVHEEPFIKGGNSTLLAPGMAFSIEPGIYIPGEVGMRIEDIYIVNEKGEGETLNHVDRELTIL